MFKLTFTLILGIYISCFKSFGQCGIDVSVIDDGSKKFLAQNEKIFNNERYELGIQAAYVQLEVLKHPTNSDLMTFRILVTTANKGSFPNIIPRFLEIKFSNGESLNLTAESSQNPRLVESIKVFTSIFKLGVDNFVKLGKVSIESIKVSDNRTGESLANPGIFKNILKEQAMCLANAVIE